ncbi:MAG: hypothetical protein SPF84_08490, partial [Lachnospiraceae bacterium]|nr:hypothetical protein [Lachnospiraceae bacterium]
YSLCFFDGKEETVITDSFDRNSCYAAASEKAVITYKAYNQSDFDKVKLSEIESVYDVNNMIDSVLATSADFYVAAKNTVSEIEKEKEVLNFGINASGSAIYYIDDVPESKNHGSLYRIIIENGEVGEPEVYDNDVYINSIDFVSDKQLKYFKDYKDNVGELYINKEMIDFDVYQPSIAVRTDLNKVFYFNDWNEEKEYGTLKVYQEGETIKIADDLHDFFVNGSGHVLFLSDYSLKYNYGELYEWYNGETEKVDEDVSCIIHVSYGR